MMNGAGPEQGVCSVPPGACPSLPGAVALPAVLAAVADPWHWSMWIFGTGSGLAPADTLPLPPQATGPFLHIGILGGMTLLAWPLASFIYRTHNTGNTPPRSPPPSLAGTLLSTTQLSSTGGRVVYREHWCSRNRSPVLNVVVKPALGCCFSCPALGAASAFTALLLKDGYGWQTESCRSAGLGCKDMWWAKNKFAVCS